MKRNVIGEWAKIFIIGLLFVCVIAGGAVGIIVSVYAVCALTGNSLDMKYFGTPELKQWEWLTFLGIAIGILGFGVSFFAICIRPFYTRKTIVEFLNKLGGTDSPSKSSAKFTSVRLTTFQNF